MRLRLLNQLSSRLTQQGDLLIKASSHRTQERNRLDAMDRLQTLLHRAAIPPKKRKKTKPTRSSIEKRIEKKKLRGKVKVMRRGFREE
jgi:ribosome-associated protein